MIGEKSILIKFDQVWSSLIKFDPFWTDQVWNNISIHNKGQQTQKRGTNKQKKLDASQIKKCFYEKFSLLQKELKWLFYFWFFWIRSVQNGSNLIKLDQIGFSQQSKNVTIKSCHIYRKDKNVCFILIFLGSDPSKMDQTWSNWISHQSKNVTIKSCHIYKKDKNGCFSLDFFGSDLSKMDQTWSNWISNRSKNVAIKSWTRFSKR